MSTTIFGQYPARAPIRPGMLLRFVLVKNPKTKQTEHWVTPHDVRGGKCEYLFAIENENVGAEPYDAYSERQQVQTVLRPATVDVLLATDQFVCDGSPLVSNGDGYLCHSQSVPNAAQIACHASEDVDLRGNLPPRLIKARKNIQ